MSPVLSKELAIQLVRSHQVSRGPVSVDIELSNRCNLRCPMCWFHGENGIGDRYFDSEMDTGEVLRLLDQVAEYKPRIYFGGAEPFIRDDFIAIVRHAKTHHLPVSFATNGTLLNPNTIQEIVGLGVDRVNFSIDGPEDLHDMLRGPDTFGRAVSNLRHVLECKRARNVERPLVTVNLTVSPLVVGHLKETIRSIRNAIGDEVDSFRIHHLWFIGEAELSAHRAAVKKALGRSAPGAAAHRIPLSQSVDSVALADEISDLKDLEGVDFFPNLRGEEIHEFYSEGSRSKRRCNAPFQAVVVKPNGDVKFCPDEWIDDYVLGNIREHEFRTIWSNERARHFRSVLLRRGSFPCCKRCSWMYCF